MEKNKKLKKTKDSILIRKSGKHPENAGEIARQRSIYMLVVECGILITYLIFLILYTAQNKFKMLYLILQLAFVFLEIVSSCFSIHSMIFFKEYIITKSSNLSILIYCLIIVPFVLMYLEIGKFTLPIILQMTFLSCCLILCSLDQYLIRIFVIDFLKEKQRYNLKAALHNRKSFEDQLQKSIMSKSEDFT